MAEPAPTLATRTPANAAATLSREINDFLIEFSIAVHRYSMYPSDHPSLGPAAGNVLSRVSRLLGERTELSLGVAHRQLVIDGVATDQRNPVLADLSKRLHAHHIGAITFSGEVDAASLERVLRTMAEEPEREGNEPIGLRGPDRIPSWPGVRLIPVGYSDLTLDDTADSSGENQVLQLWLGLARAAMAGNADFSDADDVTPGVVAEHMRKRKERAYDQVIVGYLLQISDQLGGEGRTAGPLREKISQLVAELDEDTLKRILRMGGDNTQRRRFVKGAVGGLSSEASIKILKAAADASGQEISALMVRLLTKLSFHSKEGGEHVRNPAERAVREKVDELLEDWTLDNPNPDGYVRILDELSRASPYLDPEKDELDLGGSALSMVQMALEVDAFGPMIESALDELLVEGGLPIVAPMIEGAQMTKAGRLMRERVGSPAQIEALVDFEDVSEDSLGLLVEMVGEDASIEPLLRVLAEAESRALRRTVFDRLVSLGARVGRPALPFLEDPRWYVVRNMLSLLAALPALPTDFTALPFLTHVDLRVRRVALPLALTEAKTRVKAIVSGLREGDERMVRTALLDVRESIPPTVVPIVVDRVLRSDTHPEGLRVLGVRVLESVHRPSVREVLIDLACSGKSWFGRPRLRQVDGEGGDLVLAALSALAREWSEDPEIRPILKVARKSRDVGIRRVLGEASAATARRRAQPAPQTTDAATLDVDELWETSA